MGNYDRYDDRNREARKRGERDGERGYGYDWQLRDDRGECGEAYRDGLREGCRNRWSWEAREQAEEQRARERAQERRKQEEAEYYAMIEQQPPGADTPTAEERVGDEMGPCSHSATCHCETCVQNHPERENQDVDAS